MRNLKLFIPAILLILVASSFTLGKWRIIGQIEANYGLDRDVMVIGGNDIYKAIKIKVADAGLNMVDMDVYFENGEKMNVAIQKNFHQGEESRVIDFPGNRRRIGKITFLYDTKGIFKGKANVIVFGKK